MASTRCKALCGGVPFPPALIKAVYVIPSGRRPWRIIPSRSCPALNGSVPAAHALIKRYRWSHWAGGL